MLRAIAAHPFRTLVSVLVWLAMAVYPTLELYLLTKRESAREEILYTLAAAGFAGAISQLAGKAWWTLIAVVFGFMLTFYAFFTGSGGAVLFNGALGIAIIIYAGHTPPDQRTLPSSDKTAVGQAASSPPMEPAMPEGGDVETLKYRLEAEKFQWQRATQKSESSILNRHFGVIITAIVSLSAIVVSYLQLGISANNAKAQIETERLKNDRQFYLEIARFLLTYEQDLKSNDIEKVTYLKDVVISAFPPEVAIQIVTTMQTTARNPATRRVWDDALRSLQARARAGATKS